MYGGVGFDDDEMAVAGTAQTLRVDELVEGLDALNLLDGEDVNVEGLIRSASFFVASGFFL